MIKLTEEDICIPYDHDHTLFFSVSDNITDEQLKQQILKWQEDSKTLEKINSFKFLNNLAELEHIQWLEWTSDVRRNNKLSARTLERWDSFSVPFEELSDEDKLDDYQYARVVLKLFKEILNEELEQSKIKTYRKITTVTAELFPYDSEIKTLEGIMKGKKGDYCVTGSNGEEWVVRKDIFEKTYVEVEE